MAKLNKIIVDSIEYDVGEVQRMNEMPTTVSNDSPEIIIYNNQLYIKTIGENDVMTYELIKAGSNGTQIEANPELTGDETTLSSISIDGVNYDIPEGAKAYVEDEEMLVIDDGDIHVIETSYIEQEVAALREYVDQEVLALQEYVNGKISVTVNDDDTIDVTIN